MWLLSIVPILAVVLALAVTRESTRDDGLAAGAQPSISEGCSTSAFIEDTWTGATPAEAIAKATSIMAEEVTNGLSGRDVRMSQRELARAQAIQTALTLAVPPTEVASDASMQTLDEEQVWTAVQSDVEIGRFTLQQVGPEWQVTELNVQVPAIVCDTEETPVGETPLPPQ
jgi:hypothetical protein